MAMVNETIFVAAFIILLYQIFTCERPKFYYELFVRSFIKLLKIFYVKATKRIRLHENLNLKATIS